MENPLDNPSIDRDRRTKAAVSRRAPLGLISIAGFVLIALVILYIAEPNESSYFPRCSLFQLTGIHCPGCGGLRAWHDLLHGNLLAALDRNVLAVTLFPLLATWWYGQLVWTTWRPDSKPYSLPNWLLWAALGIVVVFTVTRNLPWDSFRWLAP